MTASRRATLSLLGSAALFAIMAFCVKLASRQVPGPQIAFVRFVAGVVIMAAVWLGGRVSLRPHRWRWLAARGVFGGVAVLAYFACIEHVPVGLATLLNYTAPIFTMLFSWWLLGERPGPGIVGALSATVVGVALVVGVRVSQFHAGGWELIGLGSAVCSGLAVTSVRAARRDGGDAAESAWSVFFSFTVIGSLVTLPSVVPPAGAWVAPTAGAWVLIAGAALSSVGAQIVMTEALQHVTGPTSGVIHQLTVVLTGVGGVTFFGDRLPLAAVAGSALTMAGVVWTVWAGSRPSDRGLRSASPPHPRSPPRG